MVVKYVKAVDRSLFRALVRDSALGGLSVVISRGFMLLLNLIVARSFTDPAEFGIFSTVCMTVNLVAIFTGSGIMLAAIREVAAAGNVERQNQTIRTVFSLISLASIVAAVVLLVGAGWISAFLKEQVSPGMLRFAALLVMVQLLIGGVEGILRGANLFRWLPIAAGAACAVGLPVTWPLVKSMGVNGGLTALMIFLAIQCGVGMIPFARRLRGKFLNKNQTMTMLKGVAAPNFLNAIAWNGAMILPPLMLTRSQFGLAHMALWNAATQLRFILTFVPIIVAQAATPHLSRLFSEQQLRPRQAGTAIGMIMLSALALYLPLVLLSHLLMAAYGPSYGAHSGLLVLVLSFGLVQILGVGACTVLFAADRSWIISIVTVAWSAAVLIAAPYCLPVNGAYSLAWLYLLSSIPSLAAQLFAVAIVLRNPSAHGGRTWHGPTQSPLGSIEALEAGPLSLPEAATEL